MSNERIDLTKFEGLTTPWDFHAKYLHIESAKVAVNLIAELIEPYKGKIYDPCCGSGGMFVQSMKFIENHKWI